jgi:DNA polymerase-3 subunit delta
MVAIKAAGVPKFIADPPADMRLFLVFGRDAGAITERARQLEALAGSRDPAGGSPVRFGSDEVAGNPGRLSDEINAASLFGGEPVITLRITDGRHNVMAGLAPLLGSPPKAGWLIVEAGDLPPSSAVRKAFEANAHAAALPCYESDARDLAAMAHAMFADAGCTSEPEAGDMLVATIGNDRLISRSEIEKLVLFVGEGGRAGIDDVLAIVGENLNVRGDRITDDAFLGRSDAVEADLIRLRAEGQSPVALAAQALRQIIALQRMSASVAAGKPAEAVVKQARPPIFFNRQAAVKTVLAHWNATYIARSRQIMADAIFATRRQPQLDDALVSDALQRIAAMGRRLAAGGGKRDSDPR